MTQSAFGSIFQAYINVEKGSYDFTIDLGTANFKLDKDLAKYLVKNRLTNVDFLQDESLNVLVIFSNPKHEKGTPFVAKNGIDFGDYYNNLAKQSELFKTPLSFKVVEKSEKDYIVLSRPLSTHQGSTNTVTTKKRIGNFGPKGKFTEQSGFEMAKRYILGGETAKKLAVEFSCSSATIGNVAKKYREAISNMGKISVKTIAREVEEAD